MSKLNRWRARKNYTFKYIAAEIGCTVQALWNWNNGGKISTTFRHRFIERFDMDPVEDFGLEEALRVIPNKKEKV